MANCSPQRAVGVTGLQTHCLPWHFLSFSSLPRGGGGLPRWAWAGGHRCCAMERQRQRSRNEAFPQRFCSSEAGLVLGRDGIWFSESFPENLTSTHLGLPQRVLSGQQGHTHILAKHFEYPKIGRKDRGLTPPPPGISFRAPRD